MEFWRQSTPQEEAGRVSRDKINESTREIEFSSEMAGAVKARDSYKIGKIQREYQSKHEGRSLPLDESYLEARTYELKDGILDEQIALLRNLKGQRFMGKADEREIKDLEKTLHAMQLDLAKRVLEIEKSLPEADQGYHAAPGEGAEISRKNARIEKIKKTIENIQEVLVLK